MASPAEPETTTKWRQPGAGYLETFEREGCVVLPGFLSDDELQLIRAEITRILDEFDVSQHDASKTTFTTTDDQVVRHNAYFLASADRISYFFEEDALDADGSLTVPKERCLNKIGHALHWLSPVFRTISFKAAVKELVRDLGFVEPAIIQSMYIFKHPGIGGKVTPHTDRTFLHNEPCKLVGLWFAIEDVTLDNGCLWYVPGSHRTETITRRMVAVRGPAGRSDTAGRPSLKFIGEQREFADTEFVPVTVPAGGLVLIHGQVVHKSERNLSAKPRPAYTFHVIDCHQCHYSADNWLQPTPNLPFTKLYEN